MTHAGLSKSKEMITHILSDNVSLTAKQIHIRLQKQHSTTHSYQSTHKVLKQMLDENILSKNAMVYEINPEWAENNKRNAELLAEKVKTREKRVALEEMKDGESIHLSFKGIPDAGWFLIDKVMQAPNPEKTPCLALWRFAYSLVGLGDKHLTGLKKVFKKNTWHAIIEEKNEVDKMFGNTLITYGLKSVKYGVKCATPLSDKIVIGDYIIETSYPTSFRKIWAIQNRLPKKVVEFSLAKHFIYMTELQPRVEITIIKNKELADEYRKEYCAPSVLMK